MISRLRRAIAVVVAALVTAFTLGRVRVDRSGRAGGGAGEEGRGRAEVARLRDPVDSAPGADRSIRPRGR